jgi:DNA helicase HerA-like ATPase
VRATVSDLGPLLLARMLALNETQAGVLNLVFKIADDNGLALLDLKDLRAMLQHVGDNAKQFTTEYGNISAASVGAIQRGLLQIDEQGGDKFFGEPMLDIADFMQTDGGMGVINILAADRLMNAPRLYATFLLWMLSELFETLPEVGDLDKPKLVFFFDEAHLLFNDASKAFLDQIAQTVRLIRSKGVGVFFVTQSPTDVPDAVLAQLGSRVQHQLRAHTPNDAKALKATVNTYPNSAYDDLGEVLTGLGIGEAIVTVMNERGAPTPVAWTRLRAPESLMAPTDPAAMEATVAASPRNAKYATAVDRESAREMLAAKLEKGAEKAAEEKAAEEKAKADATTSKKSGSSSRRSTKDEEGVVTQVVKSGAFRQFMRTAAAEIARGLFGTGRRR